MDSSIMASLPPASSLTRLCQFVDTFHRGEGSIPPPLPTSCLSSNQGTVATNRPLLQMLGQYD